MALHCPSCRARQSAVSYRVLITDDTAPLLAHVDGPTSPPPGRASDTIGAENQPYIEDMYDHPIFLRVCHSACIDQQVVVAIRAIITLYFLVTTFMILDYKIEFETKHSWLALLLDFPIMSWMLLFVYQIIALMWSYTHCFVPPTFQEANSWFTKCTNVPFGRRLTSLSGQFAFSVFYFTVLTWSTLNTFAWVFDTQFDTDMYPKPRNSTDSTTNHFVVDLLPPTGDESDKFTMTPYPPVDAVFGQDWFKTFTYVNLLILGAGICLIEATLLNQIKVPVMPWWTLIIIAAETGSFVMWGILGVALTHGRWYAFGWLNKEAVGSRFWVVTSGVGFVLASAILYAFGFLVVWIRSKLDAVVSMNGDDETPGQNRDERNGA